MQKEAFFCIDKSSSERGGSMCSERNMITVRKEDKELFRIITGLTPEKVDFIRGIVIGLQLQDKELTGPICCGPGRDTGNGKRKLVCSANGKGERV